VESLKKTQRDQQGELATHGMRGATLNDNAQNKKRKKDTKNILTPNQKQVTICQRQKRHTKNILIPLI
jgi:hypothetical protein